MRKVNTFFVKVKFNGVISVNISLIICFSLVNSTIQKLLTDSVLQWADGIFLMYSITDRRSLEQIRQLRYRIEEARNAKQVPLAFMIVANKSDLVHQRKVSMSEGTCLRRCHGCLFFGITHHIETYHCRQLHVSLFAMHYLYVNSLMTIPNQL